ncbi:hypothetical protein [Spirosoma aerolatum]|uniref:hypothetical protein n=1 Tax=Spirosoma aerolatum TaxID=1211326 RepID=UPI0009ACF37F|nr:hypothetical protein [Spirosoma aerolatum]
MGNKKTATKEAPKGDVLELKFQCTNIQDIGFEDTYQERVSLSIAIGDNPDGSENINKVLSETPSGSMQVLVTNDAWSGFFESGHDYFITITKAPLVETPLT